MNDLIEFYNILKEMPRDFHILMSTVILLAGWAVWFLMFRKPQGVEATHKRWIDMINRGIRAGKKVERKYRRVFYIDLFARMRLELSNEIGKLEDFSHMQTWKQSLWLAILTHERNQLMFLPKE